MTTYDSFLSPYRVLDLTDEKGYMCGKILEGLGAEIIKIESARLLALRAAWMLDRRQLPNYEAAMLKMVVSEMEQQLVDTAMQIMGPYAQSADGFFLGDSDTGGQNPLSHQRKNSGHHLPSF